MNSRRLWILAALWTTVSPAIDRAAERAKMLAVLDHLPQEETVFQGLEAAPEAHRRFVEFYRDRMRPRFRRMEVLVRTASLLKVARDRALYGDATELAAWKQREKSARDEAKAISTSDEWQALVHRWGVLAENLPGPLAAKAREMRDEQERGAFTDRELPWLQRLTQIATELSDIANTSPLVAGLEGAEKEGNAVQADYYAGRVPFREAVRRMERLAPRSRAALGQDVVQRGRALFDEAAVLRTQLAQSMRFRTWAEYVAANQAKHYSEAFKTVDAKVRFLRGLLEATKGPYLEFLRRRAEEIPGLDVSRLTRTERELLPLEESTLLREYLPRERIEEEWRAAMIASGFPAEALATITLDGYPRENKYTHAYMSPSTAHSPKQTIVDARSLEVLAPPASGRDWHPANIFIVQNYRDDGPDGWTTAWHEGGHGLDFGYREDILDHGSAYGYDETHSMTMEYFLEDVPFLLHVGRTRDGRPLPETLARRYVLHSRINGLMRFRMQVAFALYDLLLWHHEYSAGQGAFTDRALKLFGELVGEAGQTHGRVVEGIDDRMGSFATGHFYSGNVRYFGYIVAHVAAAMSAEALWNRLEAETGRRTFLAQPRLAPLLVEGYYRRGFLEPFPGPVERFTGRTFAPEAFVEGVVRTVGEYRPEPAPCPRQVEAR